MSILCVALALASGSGFPDDDVRPSFGPTTGAKEAENMVINTEIGVMEVRFPPTTAAAKPPGDDEKGPYTSSKREANPSLLEFVRRVCR